MLRWILAVIVGVVVAYVLAQQLEGVLVRSAAGRNLYTAGDYFAVRNTPPILVGRLALSLAAGILGGYMAARIAKDAALRVAAIAAAALTVMLVVDFTSGEFAWGTPVWMRVALVVVTGPAMLAGAAVRIRAANLMKTGGP